MGLGTCGKPRVDEHDRSAKGLRFGGEIRPDFRSTRIRRRAGSGERRVSQSRKINRIVDGFERFAFFPAGERKPCGCGCGKDDRQARDRGA
jgi:hypothetical protein